MKTLIPVSGLYWIIILAAFCSCSYLGSSSYQIPIPDHIYTSQGPVRDFSMDEEKPKVLTLIVGLSELEIVYSYTPENKINRIIAENPEYEFLFYFVFEKRDSLKFFQKLEKYNIDYPVFADYEDSFRKENGLRNGDGSRGTIVYSMICDRKNTFVAGSVIGTSQSFFDPTFLQAKKKIK